MLLVQRFIFLRFCIALLHNPDAIWYLSSNQKFNRKIAAKHFLNKTVIDSNYLGSQCRPTKQKTLHTVSNLFQSKTANALEKKVDKINVI